MLGIQLHILTNGFTSTTQTSSFSVPYTNKILTYGLHTSSLDTLTNHANAEFSIVVWNSAEYYLAERGVITSPTPKSSYAAGDKFRIIRNGTTITWQSASSGGPWETINNSQVNLANETEYSIKAMFYTQEGKINDVTRSPQEGNITISPRTATQPRATMIRDAYAKRPVNIANIKWGTGSQVAGNYQIDYQMLQTSGRKINNRFFVKNEGFAPPVSQSAWIDGLIDYALPRYDISGSNKYIFVERFNAPGGPDVSSRGSMDINAEEYSVYNDLNQRNSIVRDALQKWQTDHCGQFGIFSNSGTVEGYKQPRTQDYNTLANYHKVNRNAGLPYQIKSGYDREIEWNTFGLNKSNYNRTITKTMPAGRKCLVQSKLPINGYVEFAAYANTGYLIFGLNESPPATISGTIHTDILTDIEYAIGLDPFRMAPAI